MEDGGVSKTIDFVDTALKENKGIRSQLLLLKARATLQKQKGISDAEKRVLGERRLYTRVLLRDG